MKKDHLQSDQVGPKQSESVSAVSRRQFLKKLGLGGAALLLPGCGSKSAAGNAGDKGNRSGKTYYVEAGGDDSNSGLSKNQPWKTLRKVNATIFEPGDVILLKAGSVWSGRLHPKGSGRPEHPITIGRYGPEAAPPPLINGDGVKAVVYLHNQEFWEIRDLEITNMADDIGDRTGVLVKAEGLGRKARHVHLQNLHVHDVQGDNQGKVAGNPKYTGGIMARATPVKHGWHDLRIESCRIGHLDRVGIHVQGGGSQMLVQNNVIFDTGGDGAIFNNIDATCLVQHNVMHDAGMRVRNTPIAGLWTWNARGGGVIQKNEVFRTRVPPYGGDGQPFDHDGHSKDVIWQYNYSHDNEGGFMLLIGNRAIIRYNISQNDGTRATWAKKPDPGGLITFTAWKSEGSRIYNNTFYVGEELETPIVNGTHKKRGPTYFTNNIVYNLGSGGYDPTMHVIYDYNLYYGNDAIDLPEDPHKITAAPQLMDPGSGEIGRESVGGYKLEAGSPAIASGKIIENNGGRDYFGNKVPADEPPNRGASNNR